MIRTLLCASLVLGAVPALAQEEEMASEEEAASVSEKLAMINCEADEIEKESDNLFEIDDAVCEIGQYDIKLDGEFTIISMTYDGPVDE